MVFIILFRFQIYFLYLKSIVKNREIYSNPANCLAKYIIIMWKSLFYLFIYSLIKFKNVMLMKLFQIEWIAYMCKLDEYLGNTQEIKIFYF